MISLALAVTVLAQSKVVAFATSKNVDSIIFDLNSKSHMLDVVVPSGFPGTDEDFSSMVRRSKAVAAINGAYFGTDNLKPIGDIVIDNKFLSRGSMGTVLAMRLDGTAEMFRVTRHKTMDWQDYRMVLGCGPALVLNGRKDVQAAVEGFTSARGADPTPRMGVGILPGNRVIFVHAKSKVSHSAFADIMLKLGCRDAMNLDGGASLAMYCNGKMVKRAGRKLTNILVVRPIQ